MLTRTENSECIRCTIPSGLTLTNVTRSIPGTSSAPDARFCSKDWIPRSEHFSNERTVPLLRTFRKRAVRIAESSAGIAQVPRASATNQGGRGGGRGDHVGRAGKGWWPAASPGSMRLMPRWNSDLTSQAKAKG